jgi:hypothetical protein
MMKSHWEITDEEFESQFQACLLDPALFTHEAHVRLGWIHINKYGEEAAIKNVEEQLKAFVAHAGAASKYNQTVTIAAIKAISHFMKRSTSTDFADFIKEFPQLLREFKRLMGVHYSIDIFTSDEAKERWLEPDLLEFK